MVLSLKKDTLKVYLAAEKIVYEYFISNYLSTTLCYKN